MLKETPFSKRSLLIVSKLNLVSINIDFKNIYDIQITDIYYVTKAIILIVK